MDDLDTGAAEQPAEESVADSINAAIAATETADAPESAAAAAERARDERGRFAAKAEEAVTDPAAAPATDQKTTDPAEPVPAATTAEVPQHWSAEDKALVAALPPEHRAAVVDRFKKIEAGFTPKLQRAAELERTWAPVGQMFEPHAAKMQATGWTPPALIQAWMQAEERLQTDPTGMIADLARIYKADLSKLVPQAATQQPATPEYVDPTVKALQDELAQIKGTVAGFTEAQQRAVEEQNRGQQNRALTEIQSFAEAKGEDGQPSHPLFNDVMTDMLELAAAARAAGRTPVLQDLYDRAVYANPVTREASIAARLQADRAKLASEQRARATAARTAGSSVSGAPSGGAQTGKIGGSKGSIKDDIMAAFGDA